MIMTNEVIHMIKDSWYQEQKLKRDLAKTNYLNIHQKRKKRR